MTLQSFIRFFATVTRPPLKLLDWLTPFFVLIVRCWVAYVFLKAGLLKLSSWDSTVMLFTHEFHVPLLSPEFAAALGTTAEIALPILLILGLGGRLVVALLFVFNLVAAISYPSLWTSDGLPGLIQHINWGAILALLMCFGTGKWSVDHLLSMFYRRIGCSEVR